MIRIVKPRSHFCEPDNALFHTVRQKFTKGEAIKRLMREEKQCFGALLETRQEKLRRLKHEKLNGSSPADIDYNPCTLPRSKARGKEDSEFLWMMRVSENRLRKIRMIEENEKLKLEIKSIDIAEVQKIKKFKGAFWLPRSSQRIFQCPVRQEHPKKCEPNLIVPKKETGAAPLEVKAVETDSQEGTAFKKIPQVVKLPKKVLQDRKVKKKASSVCRSTKKILHICEVVQRPPEDCTLLQTVPQAHQIAEIVSQVCSIQKTDPEACKLTEIVPQEYKITEPLLLDHKRIEILFYWMENRWRIFQWQKNTLSKTVAERKQISKTAECGLNLEKSALQDSKLLLKKSDLSQNTRVPIVSIDESMADTKSSKSGGYNASKILTISMMDNQQHLALPSITRILRATRSETSRMLMERWKKKMIMEMGKEAFYKDQENKRMDGTLFHQLVDYVLRKQPCHVKENIRVYLDSIANVIKEVEEIRAIESYVVHDEPCYRGVIDCVASFRGKLCLIDWKKKEKVVPSMKAMYEEPIKLASYIGALNADKNYPFKIKSGVLVVAYPMGYRSTIFELDEIQLQIYWAEWLHRLKKYYEMNPLDASYVINTF